MTLPHISLTSADWASVGAVAAAVIALASVAVAIWQARIAKAAATEAAESARQSAEAATVQAKAAVDQVELLQKQIQAESADRDTRDAPVFNLLPEAAEAGIYAPSADGVKRFTTLAKTAETDAGAWVKRVRVNLVMRQGPGEVTVVIAPGDAAEPGVTVLDPGPHRMVPQSRKAFAVVVAYKFTDQDVGLLITSTESGGRGRSWRSEHVVTS